MKTKIIFIAVSLFAVTQLTKAQNQCAVWLSLMNESARNQQFAEAFGPWKSVFKECPELNLAIYQRGQAILHWKLQSAMQQGDMVAYQEYFDLLMLMFNKRMEHFGTHATFPAARVLGLKALDYIRFSQADPLRKQAYEWLKQSVEGMGDGSDLEVLRQLVTLSNGIFQTDPTHAATFIEDYLLVVAILDRQAANPANAQQAEHSAPMRQELDILFVQSGAANCEVLDEIYSAEVDANIDNLEILNRIMAFYRRVGCTEQEVFFRAALAVHAIQPTVESAVGKARRAQRNEEWQQAIAFFTEATELSTDNIERADFQLTIATITYHHLRNFPRARTHAERALSFNPSLGRAHLLIGHMYSSTRNLTGDPVLDKTVFWVAVDRFQRARQLDSSLAGDVNNLIRDLTPHFPTREEIFFHPELNQIGIGGAFTVGGWINESTTVRPAQ